MHVYFTFNINLAGHKEWSLPYPACLHTLHVSWKRECTFASLATYVGRTSKPDYPIRMNDMYIHHIVSYVHIKTCTDLLYTVKC